MCVAVLLTSQHHCRSPRSICCLCSLRSSPSQMGAHALSLILAINVMQVCKCGQRNHAHLTNRMSAVINEQPRRGLKPGQPNPGGFRKGDDPRRAGGMRIYDGLTLAQMAREYGPECIDLWVKAMRDEELPWPVRLKASEYIVDRGYGKAVSIIETQSRSLQSMTLAELEAIARGEQPRFPITIEGEAVTLAVEHQQ